MRIIKIILIIIVTICSCLNINGQNRQKLDSLWNEYNKAKHDSTRIKSLLGIGEQFESQDPDTSIIFYKQGLGLSQELKDNKYSAKCNRYIAYVYGNILHDLVNCEKYYMEAIRFHDLEKDQKSISECYQKIGNVHYNQGSYEKAIEYYLKSLKIYEELQDKKGMAASYTNIGIIYDKQINYDKALELYLKSLKVQEEIKDKSGMANSYVNIGAIHQVVGHYDKALEFYFISLKIREKLGDKQGMASSYDNIGLINENKGDYDKALEFYFKSLKIREELKDNYELSYSYINIGEIYRNKGDYDKAIESYFKSLRINEEIGDIQGMVLSYGNIGLTYEDKGDYNKAIEFYFNSLKIKEELGDKQGMAMYHNNIGCIYFKQGKPENAKKHQLLALNIAEEIGFKYQVYYSYETLAQCDSALGNFKGAYEYHKLYSKVRNTIFSKENNEKISKMITKYEAEKSQLRIEKIEKEKELQLSENRKQRILIYSFLVGFIIILVFSIFLYRMFLQKKKANLILARQKQLIEIQNSKLNQANEEITAQRDEIAAQRDLVIEQKEHIEEQKKEITDSINYAKRIQNAVLPTGDYANKILGEHFILFKPKDIVSGDFFWATRVNEWLIVTVADCTGHGVPGAFMSMLGVSFLNEIVRKKEVTKASYVLDHLRDSIIEALQQKGSDMEQKDGMDIVLCAINSSTNELQYSGANNPLFIVSALKELKQIEPDKQPVGIHSKMNPFTNHTIQLDKGDCLFFASDGSSSYNLLL